MTIPNVVTNFSISVKGTPGVSIASSDDPVFLARKFVDELKSRGHGVTSAVACKNGTQTQQFWNANNPVGLSGINYWGYLAPVFLDPNDTLGDDKHTYLALYGSDTDNGIYVPIVDKDGAPVIIDIIATNAGQLLNAFSDPITNNLPIENLKSYYKFKLYGDSEAAGVAGAFNIYLFFARSNP